MRRNTEGCRDIPVDVELYYAAFNLPVVHVKVNDEELSLVENCLL